MNGRTKGENDLRLNIVIELSLAPHFVARRKLRFIENEAFYVHQVFQNKPELAIK
jgi:predicted nuclease of restriction endonuclease-like (RecB) superfamily